ncbi:unnamed protein product [Ambrosiozyma monospora]|uniref:Unnamed protein product n=1 Tax=Ambrosiozyma monospora TaxID=43982 RepID=A0ACB5SVF0_AMBMO|nr:unnamed protein product [Ambrosiozyma monospora]
MARAKFKLLRFAIFAATLIVCGYILTRRSSTSTSHTAVDTNIEPLDVTKGTSGIPYEDDEDEDEEDDDFVPVVGAGTKDTTAKKNVASLPKTNPNPNPKPKSNGNGKTSAKEEPSFGGKEKATFVALARNSDLWEFADSIRQLEDRFNHRYHYDWVFLNDEEFSEEFKKVTTELVSGKTKYGLIPTEHWSFPPWIDIDKAAAVRQDMKERQIIYGDSISYRHMCRYESGFFFRHPLLDEYDWYWRVDPGINILCDINYDLFKYMKDNNKAYGFTITLPEYMATIPSLWDVTKEFVKENPQYVAEDNLMDWVSDDGGATYNGCHFWSNFEMG